ncbi:MAG TPA: tetratricopeptide repeat protein [Spirochaetota bacterium]|nr:tetratricopeptide repeat protein [Spirochaetota bacterium]HOL56820.1 tetratricopeptide repeat protein [Spirochaetota bacterium]HPP04232.1 tetratricopeptide repeat protein [Spirochaetota bacterium]
MKLKAISYITIFILLVGCKTVDKKKEKEVWDFDKYMMEAQKLTSNEKYLQAIDLLKEALTKFPEQDVLGLIYNIGFNYYKLKNYDEARGYFNSVIKSYEEKEFTNEQKREYQKYVILSNNLLSKIDKEIMDAKDPYHIQEELQQNKKIKPKNK